MDQVDEGEGGEQQAGYSHHQLHSFHVAMIFMFVVCAMNVMFGKLCSSGMRIYTILFSSICHISFVQNVVLWYLLCMQTNQGY